MTSPASQATPAPVALPDERGSLRELLRVAIPLVLSAGSLSIMNVIDRVLLTWYSTEALAAAMPSGILHWTIMSIPVGVVLYVNTFVAQYDGARQPGRIVVSVWQGVWVSVFSGLALLAFVPMAPWIFDLVGHDPAVRVLEVQYFETLCWGSVAVVLSNALSCFFSGMRRTAVVMWVNVISVFVNFGLDYVLIFGRGPIPEMGIRGAAIATIAARVVATLCYVYLLLWRTDRTRYDFRRWPRLDRQLFGRLMRHGVPSGLHLFVDIAGFTLFIFLIGSLGPQELAATSLAFNLNSLSFIPLFGIGMAVMTLVGNRIGEGRPDLAVRSVWNAFNVSALWMLSFAALYVAAPDLVMRPYAMYNDTIDFEAVRDRVVVLLRFVAAYSFFDAMAVIFSSGIRGAGDTKFPLLITLVCCWFIMVLPTAGVMLLPAETAAAWGGGLQLSWVFCTAYIVVAGFAMLARFLSGRWKTMQVIEADLIDHHRDAGPEATGRLNETGDGPQDSAPLSDPAVVIVEPGAGS